MLGQIMEDERVDAKDAAWIVHENRLCGTLLEEAPCEMKPSKVHGNGVFSTRKILHGEVVTMYPGDVKCDRVNEEVSLFNIPRNHPVFVDDISCMRYAQILDEIVLIGDPTKIDNPSFLGHMCNDRVKCESEREKEVYESISLKYGNVRQSLMCDYFLAMVAVRDIKKGEEIFSHYGASYWINS